MLSLPPKMLTTLQPKHSPNHPTNQSHHHLTPKPRRPQRKSRHQHHQQPTHNSHQTNHRQHRHTRNNTMPRHQSPNQCQLKEQYIDADTAAVLQQIHPLNNSVISIRVRSNHVQTVNTSLPSIRHSDRRCSNTNNILLPKLISLRARLHRPNQRSTRAIRDNAHTTTLNNCATIRTVTGARPITSATKIIRRI